MENVKLTRENLKDFYSLPKDELDMYINFYLKNKFKNIFEKN